MHTKDTQNKYKLHLQKKIINSKVYNIREKFVIKQ